jgi:hypothetical protein
MSELMKIEYGYKPLRPEMVVTMTMVGPSKWEAFWYGLRNKAIETFYLLMIAIALTVLIS